MNSSTESETTRQVSRRAVLGGGVALGAATALAAVAPAYARPTVPITGAARVGATFDLYPFAPGTTYPEALRKWNATTGTTMRCWKLYYQLGKFPASIDARLATIIDHGIQALISFKPAIDTKSSQAAADRNKLAAAVKMLHRNKLLAEVCLWQEVGPKDMTAKQYHEYVAFYGPVIRDYYPLVFDAPGYQGPSEWAAYDPGHAHLDGYAVDFYCGDYVNKGIRLGPLLTLAGRLPVGVWEIGNTASSHFMPTVSELDAYMHHITSTLSGRLTAGLPVGSVAWYNGPADGQQSGQNEIAGAHPNKLVATDVADYRMLYSAVNGRLPR
jgi:hypothetical protein